MIRDKLEFVAILAKELPQNAPSVVVELAQKLMRIGATHGRLAEAYCNGDIDDKTFCERQVALNRRLVRLLDASDIRFKTGNDPRGFTLKLLLPSKRSNTWGGEADGYGVPGS